MHLPDQAGEGRVRDLPRDGHPSLALEQHRRPDATILVERLARDVIKDHRGVPRIEVMRDGRIQSVRSVASGRSVRSNATCTEYEAQQIALLTPGISLSDSGCGHPDAPRST